MKLIGLATTRSPTIVFILIHGKSNVTSTASYREVTGATTTYTFTDLDHTLQYYIRVAAVNVAELGDLSTEVAGTPFMHVTTGAGIIWQNTLDAGVSLEPSLKGNGLPSREKVFDADGTKYT